MDDLNASTGTHRLGPVAFAWKHRIAGIATVAVAAILVLLVLRFGFGLDVRTTHIPLLVALCLGGLPLLYQLSRKLLRLEFGSDLLGGIAVVTSVLLGEYLAGTIIVLMLSGGQALENYALRSANSVLAALAKRMPSVAHRKRDSGIDDVTLAEVAVGDVLEIHPHEICPADGVVLEGHGAMDESYLTGEPFQIHKTTGSNVISGAVNGDAGLTIRTTKLAADSRYAKIVEVMRDSESKRPRLRRLGDSLGAIYTPVALDGGHPRLGPRRRLRAVPRGPRDRHPLSLCSSRSPSPSSDPSRCAPSGRSSSRIPRCWSRSPSAGPRSSTRPGH
jgi:cation transport ATPase